MSSTNRPLSGVPKRKPLPGAVAPPVADQDPEPPGTEDPNHDIEKTAAATTPATEPATQPQTKAQAYSQPMIPEHKSTQSQSQWQQLQQKWNAFSTKKKRIIVGGLIASLALIALIIGLAVGLTRGSKGSDLPLPTSNGGPYTGDLTYYDPGLGSCGITSSSSEKICAVSHTLFDAALTSGNPNENPLCGLKLRIRRGESSVDVTVVDRCPGCKVDDLDVSSSVFEELGNLAEGRVTVQWAWLEETPVNIE
ncbi:RlpA-like double-psi beta-barrel-protein domain-containing protein-containing protein [Aspergillus filifer]